MSRNTLRSPAFSLVIAVLVLVLAMAGGATAGSLITSKKIKDGTIKGEDIHPLTITAGKLADDTIHARQLGGTTQVVGSALTVAANGNNSTSVACPVGTQVISGGGGASSFLVFNVESFQSGNGWLWVVHNADAASHTFYATAVCLTAPVELSTPETEETTGPSTAGDANTPPQPSKH